MRHAVVVAVDLDVIVNVDTCFLPFSIFVSLRGQWFENRPFNRFKLRMTRAGQFFERLMIELLDQWFDGSVEFRQSEESQLPQSSQNPALNNLNADFDLGFVPRFSWAGRQCCRVVMFEHLGISLVE